MAGVAAAHDVSATQHSWCVLS